MRKDFFTLLYRESYLAYYNGQQNDVDNCFHFNGNVIVKEDVLEMIFFIYFIQFARILLSLFVVNMNLRKFKYGFLW